MDKNEEIIKDTLYEMKTDLGIDVDDIVIGARLYRLLVDIWQDGKEKGLNSNHLLAEEYQKGYNEGVDECDEKAREAYRDGREEGYEEGFEDGRKSGWADALGRFENRDIG